MSEPSKWAREARRQLANCGLAFDRPVDQDRLVTEIQQALAAALAERDKRIAELEAEVKGWSDANKAQSPVHLRVVTELQATRQRLASLQALMERVWHDGNEAGCFKNCPRCAYQKLLEEWK